MGNNRNIESTPLSVWIVMASLILFLSGTFTLLGETIRTHIISKQITAIHQHSTCNKGDTKIFAFGSSMFRTGIANRFEVKNWISDSSNLCVERAGYLNLTLASVIRNKNVVKAIGSGNPDIILIESQVLHYKSRSENKFEEGRPRQTIRMLKQHVKANNRFAMDNYPKPFFNGVLDDDAANEEAKKAVTNRQLRDFNEIQSFLNALQSAAVNSKIIIIDIPRLATIQEALNQRDQELLLQYKSSFTEMGIDYWKFNQLLENELFFDVIHLNKAGQKIYMDWLLAQIETEIRK